MNLITGHKASNLSAYAAGAAIVLILLLFANTAGFAQNTKGDRPTSSRDSRFKTSPKKVKPRSASKKIKSSARSQTVPNYSPRGRVRGGERAGRPIKPVWTESKPRDRQRPWKGDIAGKRIRHKNASSVKPNVHSQKGTFARTRVQDREGRQNVTGGRTVRARSATGKVNNVYPQSGAYVNKRLSQPRNNQNAVSNRSTLARLKTLQSKRTESNPRRKAIVIPRTASRAYIRHKSINVYANFKRPKKKTEQAQTRDIAGRRLRTKNFETPRPGLIEAPNIYRGRRMNQGDRAHPGPKGPFQTATRTGRAWRGDLTGREMRHRNRTSKKSVEGIPSLARRPRTASRPGEKRVMPSLTPKYFGRVTPGLNFQGNKRPYRTFQDQGEGFSGWVRARRPLKGGGSVKRKTWNNGGAPLEPRLPKGGFNINSLTAKRRVRPPFADAGEGFAGKQRLRSKNRVDVSGIPVRHKGRQAMSDQGEEFTGFIKAKKPVKGGGSVSGKLWNNKETPILGKMPPAQAYGQAEFKGKSRQAYVRNKRAHELALKKQKPERETYAVDGLQIRVKQRDYVKNKDLPDNASLKAKQTPTDREVAGLQVRVKRRDYVRNKNLGEDAMLKLKPTQTDQDVAALQVKVKRRDYVRNPNSAEASLLKLRPTKVDREMSELQVRVRQYKYIRNPSSAEAALKVREPGKAFARATDYQGNIKMQKYKLFERDRGLHPDAAFVKTNKNNVREERDTMTNLKLWWARLFKKQENQPEHLKDKGKKPRYDKGEIGLWYD